MAVGFGKLVVEMLQLLAGGSLAMQSVVLAASLFQKIADEPEPGPAPQTSRLALPGGQTLASPSWRPSQALSGPLPSTLPQQAARSTGAQAKVISNQLGLA